MIIENQEQVTEAVLSELQRIKDPRLREVLSAAVRHLHELAREVQLSEAEFRRGCAILAQAGQLTTKSHNEMVLLAGTLGLSSLVCLLNNGRGQDETTANLLGPFWRALCLSRRRSGAGPGSDRSMVLPRFHFHH